MKVSNKETAFRAIVAANIDKAIADREKVIDETMLFLGNFPKLSPAQVKELTLVRASNGHKDPTLVSIDTIPTPEALAENLENRLYIGDYVVLRNGEALAEAKPELASI